MLMLFALTLVVVVIAILLLGINIFFTKKGKFPNTHVGGSKALSDKGVYCVQTQDYMEYNGIKDKPKHLKKKGK